MQQKIPHITVLVKDYDEAIAFYTQKLSFDLLENIPVGNGKRWVVIRPKGSACGLALILAETPEQIAAIGNQTGGAVSFFLHTDNFERDYQSLITHEVSIVQQPIHQPYGTVAVFADLYGNLWDLIQPKLD